MTKPANPEYPPFKDDLASDPDRHAGDVFIVNFTVQGADSFWRYYQTRLFSRRGKHELTEIMNQSPGGDDVWNEEHVYVRTKFIRKMQAHLPPGRSFRIISSIVS